uniref:Uncharacterized protein n=1 Tax=Pyxicephalus adspersus TaxID=30357 RepID=A0AAV2ZTW6_PYXAD|nr:TPA: hypothetical protein GDO54_002835 [Pyxicephalus adspersus]
MAFYTALLTEDYQKPALSRVYILYQIPLDTGKIHNVSDLKYALVVKSSMKTFQAIGEPSIGTGYSSFKNNVVLTCTDNRTETILAI